MMHESVRQAIRDRLSYLQDNRERYVRLAGYPPSHPIVRDYDEQIRQLQEELKEA